MKFSAGTVGGEGGGVGWVAKTHPCRCDYKCTGVTTLDLPYSATSRRFHPVVRQIAGIPYSEPLQHALCAGGKGSAAW